MVGFCVGTFQPESGLGLKGVVVCLMLFQVFFATGVCGHPTVDCNGADGTFIPNPTSCSTYYRCAHGTPILMPCPTGLEFNVHLNVCDWPRNVACENGVRPDVTTAQTTTPTPTTTPSTVDCNGTHGTFLADPTDCGRYYRCVHGSPVSMSCPSGLYFNLLLNVCDWPQNVSCENGHRQCVGWHQFQCSDLRCISFAARCNGSAECIGSDDEANCTCSAGQVPCATGNSCIREDYWCDSFFDCADESDEANCPAGCTGHHKFECGDGSCLYIAQTCNGYENCSDGSDEADCNGCSGGDFSCGNGTCIKEYRVCDTVTDCADGADELEANCIDL